MVKETMSPKERVEAAIKLEPYDRVPVVPLIQFMFPVRHQGKTIADGYNDYWGTAWPAVVATWEETRFDGFIEYGSGHQLMYNPKRPFADGKTAEWDFPGKQLPVNSPPQYKETDVLKLEDYDEIIRLGWFGWSDKLDYRAGIWSNKKELNTRKDYVDFMEQEIKDYKEIGMAWGEKNGVPSLVGTLAPSPLFALTMGRGITRFAMDLHRMPDKIEAVMDAMIDDFITNTLEICRLVGVPGITVMMKAGGYFYPLKTFERFEFKYVKKMIDACAAEGIISVLHLDQDWGLNMPYFLDLPKKMCVCALDSCTDIFKAKEILKDHMCLAGDVPPSMLSIGTPEDVETYCKKLIDIVGKDTGLLLGSGCTTPHDTKFENFKAMCDTARNYYPH